MISVRCPICQNPMEVEDLGSWPAFPFCSPRCRTIDLGRWLGESYRLPEGPDQQDLDVPGEDEPVP